MKYYHILFIIFSILITIFVISCGAESKESIFKESEPENDLAEPIADGPHIPHKNPQNSYEEINSLKKMIDDLNTLMTSLNDKVKETQSDVDNLKNTQDSPEKQNHGNTIDYLKTEILDVKTKLEEVSLQFPMDLNNNDDFKTLKEGLSLLSDEIKRLGNQNPPQEGELINDEFTRKYDEFSLKDATLLAQNTKIGNLKSQLQEIETIVNVMQSQKSNPAFGEETSQQGIETTVFKAVKYMFITLDESFIFEALYQFKKNGREFFLNDELEFDASQHGFAYVLEDVKMPQEFSYLSLASWVTHFKGVAFQRLPNPLQTFWVSFLPNLKKIMTSAYLKSSPFFNSENHPTMSHYTRRKYLFLVIISSQGLLHIVPIAYNYTILPILNLLKDLALAPYYTTKGVVYDIPKTLLGKLWRFVLICFWTHTR